jgi:hypothetical protein
VKLNVTTPIVNLQGEPMTEGEEKTPVTLRTLIDATITSTAGTDKLTNDKKSKLFQIGLKLWADKEVNFTVDELALVKERADDVFPSAVVYGRLCELIEKPVDTPPADPVGQNAAPNA